MPDMKSTAESLNMFAKEVHDNAQRHGWYDGEPRNFGELVALMHSELSEMLEDYRNGKGLTEVYYEGNKPCGVPIEAADVLIRLLDACAYWGVNIGEAIVEKHKYNLTRPFRHGGKVI